MQRTTWINSGKNSEAQEKASKAIDRVNYIYRQKSDSFFFRKDKFI